jgi:hypothetical protein
MWPYRAPWSSSPALPSLAPPDPGHQPIEKPKCRRLWLHSRVPSWHLSQERQTRRREVGETLVRGVKHHDNSCIRPRTKAKITSDGAGSVVEGLFRRGMPIWGIENHPSLLATLPRLIDLTSAQPASLATLKKTATRGHVDCLTLITTCNWPSWIVPCWSQSRHPNKSDLLCSHGAAVQRCCRVINQKYGASPVPRLRKNACVSAAIEIVTPDPDQHKPRAGQASARAAT